MIIGMLGEPLGIGVKILHRRLKRKARPDWERH